MSKCAFLQTRWLKAHPEVPNESYYKIADMNSVLWMEKHLVAFKQTDLIYAAQLPVDELLNSRSR